MPSEYPQTYNIVLAANATQRFEHPGTSINLITANAAIRVNPDDNGKGWVMNAGDSASNLKRWSTLVLVNTSGSTNTLELTVGDGLIQFGSNKSVNATITSDSVGLAKEVTLASTNTKLDTIDSVLDTIETNTSNQFGTQSTLDKYLSEFATNGSTTDATGDYSSVADEFDIAPGAGEIWNVSRLIISVVDGTAMAPEKYGALTALTNGVSIKVFRGVTEKIDLTPDLVKTIEDYAAYTYDTAHSDYSTGDEFFHARWTFTRGGTFIKLDGDQSDKIVIRLNDSFTGLVHHKFLAQGYKD